MVDHWIVWLFLHGSGSGKIWVSIHAVYCDAARGRGDYRKRGSNAERDWRRFVHTVISLTDIRGANSDVHLHTGISGNENFKRHE